MSHGLIIREIFTSHECTGEKWLNDDRHYRTDNALGAVPQQCRLNNKRQDTTYNQLKVSKPHIFLNPFNP
jgi:hypothetical protein